MTAYKDRRGAHLILLNGQGFQLHGTQSKYNQCLLINLAFFQIEYTLNFKKIVCSALYPLLTGVPISQLQKSIPIDCVIDIYENKTNISKYCLERKLPLNVM